MRTFILFCFFFTTSSLFAQYPNIRVSQPGSTNPEEVTIAINPTNPRNLAAGAYIDYYYNSMDGGLTFGKDIFVTSQPGGWDFDVPGISRCNGLPVTACDISNSPYRGHIYITWSDQRHGEDDTDIFLNKSSDSGNSWSEIKRVNDDKSAAQQFYPWMTVDPMTGTIYIIFYDRRNTQGNETEVYVAASEYGGDTFTNFKVSESAFTPTSEIFFGDYINIAALDDTVYPIWMRMDESDLSVWMAIIGVLDRVEEQAGIDEFELLQNYPSPFNPETTISFQLPQTTTVTLSVYNTKGQLVQTLVNEQKSPGLHSVTWDVNGISSGIYFYKITAGKYSAVKKCTILR